MVGPVVGCALAVLGVLVAVQRTGLNILNLIQPGEAGPSATVIHDDFPGSRFPAGLGHDGQQFYAIARQPMHWHRVALSLDRPLYRLQRPLLPWLAWVLHPQGGGSGLILALFAVGIAASLAGGVALAIIAADHGRSAWWGGLFPLLPGALVALRITTSDGLAVALALAAIAAAGRRHTAWAIGLAVGSVLAKEVVVVMLVGYALSSRSRSAVLSASAGVAAAGALALALRIALPVHGPQILELTWPFFGLARSVSDWAAGHNRLASGTAVATVLASGYALWRTRPGQAGRSTFWLPTLLSASFLVLVTEDTMNGNLNGPRTMLPLLVLSVVCLLTGGRTRLAGRD